MDILVRTLRQLECFQVQAETDVINASWDTKSKSNGLADSVGLMVYEGTQVYLQLYSVSSWDVVLQSWAIFGIIFVVGGKGLKGT